MGEKMSVQTFVLGFALLIAGLVVGQLVKHHYGWLVISCLAAIIGIASTAYLIGHEAGISSASAVAHKVVLSIVASKDPVAIQAYPLVDDLPSDINKVGMDGWPLFVSFLLMVFGGIATWILLSAHIMRIRRAAEIGAKPEDIKVQYEFK